MFSFMLTTDLLSLANVVCSQDRLKIRYCLARRGVSWTLLKKWGLKSLHKLSIIQIDEDNFTLEGFTNLKDLSVRFSHCYDISGHWLKSLQQLTTLRLEGLFWFNDFTVFQLMINLRELYLKDNDILENMDDFKNCVKLTVLSFTWFNMLRDITAIKKLQELQEFTLVGGDYFDLSSLIGMKKLKKLVLNHYEVDDNIDLSSIGKIDSLVELKMENFTEAIDLHFLGISNIKSLSIYNFPKLTDITSLGNIEELLIEECETLRNFLSIGDIKTLKKMLLRSVTIDNTSFLKSEKHKKSGFFDVIEVGK